MSYQAHPDRPVEESYDAAAAGRLLPASAGVNVGASNSSRGAGTTADELTARFRAYDGGASLCLLVGHALPLLFRPTRLARLLASPARLILEAVAGGLALGLLLVAARVPALGARAVRLGRRCQAGDAEPWLDLDAARGRAAAWALVGTALGLSNYVLRAGAGAGGGGGGGADEVTPATNGTDVTVDGGATGAHAGGAAAAALFALVRATLLFPPAALALLLAGYTAHAVRTCPAFAAARAYPAEGTADPEPVAGAPPAWSTVGLSVPGRGYQSVGA